ncbi:MAG: hypothetical protein ABR583_06995 [Gaiellaceae bacterium]
MQREQKLLRRADLVFTGGRSLYEAKHFAQARGGLPDPPDQRGIADPRLGFYGVLDERLDCDLIARIADLRPDWLLILLGPASIRERHPDAAVRVYR